MVDSRAAGVGVGLVLSTTDWQTVRESLGLTDRELEITQGALSGKTEVAIGEWLGISPLTVHSHFQNIYRKLGIRTRSDLIICVVQVVLYGHHISATEFVSTD